METKIFMASWSEPTFRLRSRVRPTVSSIAHSRTSMMSLK